MIVRKFLPKDYEDWERMYLDYGSPWNERIGKDRLQKVWHMLNDPAIHAYGIGMATEEDRMISLGHYIIYPCTYSTKHTCYLQDLYVVPEQRQQGIAKKIIDYLAQMGIREGWRNIHWRTKSGNYNAISAYDRFAERSDWIHFEKKLG